MSPSKQMEHPFGKYSGCGNDFVLIDHRTPFLEFPLPKKAIAKLCHRQLGIGSDGFILLEESSTADFKMRIFNADGSEAEMCGNGIRCLARFLCDIGLPKQPWRIETLAKEFVVHPNDSTIAVFFSPPTNVQYNLSLTVDGKEILAHFLDTGVPHAVIFVDNIEDPQLMKDAPSIRHHPIFSPKGTNVDFVFLRQDGTIDVRTYERGVENETLACGTGVVAAALVTAKLYQQPFPIKAHTRSKDILQLDRSIDQLVLSGPAVRIYQGIIPLESMGFRLK